MNFGAERVTKHRALTTPPLCAGETNCLKSGQLSRRLVVIARLQGCLVLIDLQLDVAPALLGRDMGGAERPQGFDQIPRQFPAILVTHTLCTLIYVVLPRGYEGFGIQST